MTPEQTAFVLAHGWRARVDHLAAILQQPATTIARVRQAGCTRLPKPKTFPELFAIWHGRPPRDEEWPAPSRLGSSYEILGPELALVARLVGVQSTAEMAAILTARLQRLTGDPAAQRSRADVQRMQTATGLVAKDVLGGLTIAAAVARSGRKDVTRGLLQQQIAKGLLQSFRVGMLKVIPVAAFDAWLAARLPEPPDGWVKLWDIEEQLGQHSDSRLSWYAKQGLIPGALFCAGHRWWIAPDQAQELIRRYRAGEPMPWSGKYAHPSTTKRSYVLWQTRRHRACAECRAIWQPVGGEPRSFEEFHPRWMRVPEPQKRHLTAPDGLSALKAAESLGIEKHTVTDAIASGVLPAKRISGRWVIDRRDLQAWMAGISKRGAMRNVTTRKGYDVLTFKHAASRYRLTRRQLQRAIAAGELHVVRRWDGTPGLRPRECAALFAKIGGLSLGDAAKYAGLSKMRFLASARVRGWKPGRPITRRLAHEVRRRHSNATWQLTFPEAAKRLRRSTRWVRAAVQAGLLKVLKGVDERRTVLGRKSVDALIRRGIPALPDAPRRGRPVVWLQQFKAVEHAGVTVSTLLRWQRLGDVVVEQRIDGPYYTRTSVERRARQYWTRECHFKRAVPPAWLRTSEAA